MTTYLAEDQGSIYTVTLGNGLSWRLTAMSGTELWLKAFASIMHFTSGESPAFANITFIKRPPRKPWRWKTRGLPGYLSDVALPINEWRCTDFNYFTFWYHPESVDCFCELNNMRDRGAEILMMWHSLHGIYRGLIDRGGFPVHAALLERDGLGVLLIAGEGGGKSTSSRRIPAPWKALSDDGAVLAPGAGSKYVAHPFPTWSELLLGRSNPTWEVQRGIPLAAVFFLEKGDRDEVIPVGQGRAAIMINASASYICSRGWKGSTRKEKSVFSKKIFLNSCGPAQSVPSFILRATLSGHFWKEMDKVVLA